MKNITTLILFFCLPPMYLLAQEAVVVCDAIEKNGSFYPSPVKDIIFNNQACKDNKLCKITYSKSKNRLQDVFIYDTAGRIIKQELNNAEIIIDSIFQDNKIIVSEQNFSFGEIKSLNSTIIEKVRLADIHGKQSSYEKSVTKTYIKGKTISRRNKQYNKAGLCICGALWFDRYGESYYMIPGVQVEAPMDAYFFKTPQKNEPMCCYLKSNEKLYLIRQTIELKNFLGISEKKKRKLLAKRGTKYFVQQFNCTNCMFKGHCCLSSVKILNDNLFSNIIYHKNKYNLIDTAYLEYYPAQDNNAPCVKPNNSNTELYLSGRSGVPQKTLLYTLHYEYFDE